MEQVQENCLDKFMLTNLFLLSHNSLVILSVSTGENHNNINKWLMFAFRNNLKNSHKKNSNIK